MVSQKAVYELHSNNLNIKINNLWASETVNHVHCYLLLIDLPDGIISMIS
jgi:hypothetical protein